MEFHVISYDKYLVSKELEEEKDWWKPVEAHIEETISAKKEPYSLLITNIIPYTIRNTKKVYKRGYALVPGEGYTKDDYLPQQSEVVYLKVRKTDENVYVLGSVKYQRYEVRSKILHIGHYLNTFISSKSAAIPTKLFNFIPKAPQSISTWSSMYVNRVLYKSILLYKYDGMRLVVVQEDGLKTLFYTRHGSVIDESEFLSGNLRDILIQIPFDCILEAELYSTDHKAAEVAGDVKKGKYDNKKIAIFNIIGLCESMMSETYEERWEFLKTLKMTDTVHLAKEAYARDFSDLEAMTRDVEHPYEGFVLWRKEKVPKYDGVVCYKTKRRISHKAFVVGYEADIRTASIVLIVNNEKGQEYRATMTGSLDDRRELINELETTSNKPSLPHEITVYGFQENKETGAVRSAIVEYDEFIRSRN